MSASSAVAPIPRARLNSIDILRGLVMVIMALDHARDYMTIQTVSATDVTKASAALFLTRWITHYCAPVFVFLAGAGAMLSLQRGKPVSEVSHFLWTRGLWLIFLEYVVIRWELTFNWNYLFSMTQVIAVIGMSMIVLSALLRLPPRFIGIAGLLIVGLHNTLDPIRSNAPLWLFFFRQGVIPMPNGGIHLVAYPLLPWMGILFCGYWFATVYRLDEQRRRAIVRKLGLGLTLAFVILRFTNVYGDPGPWQMQKSALFTALSFVNCQKYPPSLLFVLMTIGPALILLSYLPDRRSRVWSPMVVFGRVPMFYYLLHLLFIHGLVLIYAYAKWGRAEWVYTVPGFYPDPKLIPADFGHSLAAGYVLWITVVLLLYPLCRWFASVRERTRSAWLSYL